MVCGRCVEWFVGIRRMVCGRCVGWFVGIRRRRRRCRVGCRYKEEEEEEV